MAMKWTELPNLFLIEKHLIVNHITVICHYSFFLGAAFIQLCCIEFFPAFLEVVEDIS